MKSTLTLRTEIEARYSEFFKLIGIDPDSGIWENAPEGERVRFATMPFIGGIYSEVPSKILFVGQDIGCDEYRRDNRMQTFDERLCNIMDSFPFYNPHIAGTYLETLYLLKDHYDQECRLVRDIENTTNQSAVGKLGNQLPKSLLDQVCLLNLHKFVTVDREKRLGNENRRFYGKDDEILNLFFDEVTIINPDIIWFQGNLLWDGHYKRLASEGRQEYVAHHPSYYQRSVVLNNESVRATTPKYIRLLVDHCRNTRYGLYEK